MNPILENIKTRRSIRTFKNETVNKSDVQQVVEGALWAPNGMDRQNWQFTVIQNPTKIKELAKVMAKALGKPEEAYTFYHPNVLIVTSGASSDKNNICNCACAMQNMMLVAHSLGLGSVWINQARDVGDVAEVRRVFTSLEVPEDHNIFGMLALGVIDGEYPQANPRKGVVKYI